MGNSPEYKLKPVRVPGVGIVGYHIVEAVTGHRLSDDPLSYQVARQRINVMRGWRGIEVGDTVSWRTSAGRQQGLVSAVSATAATVVTDRTGRVLDRHLSGLLLESRPAT